MRTEYKEGELLTKEDIGLVFKSRDGNEWKLVAFLDVPKIEFHSLYKIIAISNKRSDPSKFTINGDFDADDKCEHDLVSFVGPDFTEDKKLRKFEFEAYLSELPNVEFTSQLAISKELGHACGSLFTEKKDAILSIFEKNTTSKWKVTMQELVYE